MCVLAGWQQRGFCFFIGKHTHQHTSCSIGHVCDVLWHYSVFRRICVQGIFVVVFVKVHEMAICSCGECPRIFWQPFLVARFSATIFGRLLLRNSVCVDWKLSYIICNSQFIQCGCALKGLHILKALKSHYVSWPFLCHFWEFIVCQELRLVSGVTHSCQNVSQKIMLLKIST